MTNKREFILKKIAELEGKKDIDVSKLVSKAIPKPNQPINTKKRSPTIKKEKKILTKTKHEHKLDNLEKKEKKIFLISSDKNLTKTLKLFLIKKGYKLLTNEFGGFPFGLVKVHKPDLIILEHNQSSEKAKEFVKLLRIHPSFHKIPVIIMTNSRSKQDVIDFFKLKIAGYMLKPIEKDKMLLKIEEILKKT